MHNLVWPRMGWRRTIRYFKYRLIRLQDSPSKISRGICAGACVSFTPLPGTHFIQAAILAYLMRGNILAALIATWVGNPWTFPGMWYASYVVGMGLFHLLGLETAHLPDHFTLNDLWREIITHPGALVLPWVIGGYLLMAATWPAVYYTVRPLIRAAQHARAERRRKRHGHYKHGHHP